MNSLVNEKCKIARIGSSSIIGPELSNYMEMVSGWELKNRGDLLILSKNFEYSAYASGLNFVNDIANISEENNHHPRIIFEYSTVIVQWWTHSINGLHRNDFVMAAKTDECWKFYSA